MDEKSLTGMGWYAVHTKPRQEEIAHLNLQRQDYASYLPHIVVRKRQKGKWTDVVEPLFPRYLFIHIDPHQTNVAPVRSTLGVSELVRFSQGLTAIPDDIITFLKDLENPETGNRASTEPLFEAGDQVQILEGPLAGLNGIYEITKGEERVLILVKLLGRQNKVLLNSDDVSKL